MLKLAVFSANYRPTDQLDSYRGGLMRYLCASGVQTLFLQASDFIDDQTALPRFSQAVSLIKTRLENFKPDGVLFINAAGRIPIIREFLEAKKIPSISWFVDHPGFFSPSLLLPGCQHTNVVANRNFVVWFKNRQSQDVDYVPFPCGFNEAPPSGATKRDLGSVFMGTMWDLIDIPYWIRCFEETRGRQVALESFYPSLRSFFSSLNIGENPHSESFADHQAFFSAHFKSEPDFMTRISNYLSTIDRIKMLSPLTGPDLSLYGPRPGWGMVIGAGHEGFLSSYRGHDIVNPLALFEICRRSKVGLNLFHVQNQGGGLNFRFAEYVQAQTPILSNRNQECEQEFPHGEAAWYCDTPEEFRQASLELLKDVKLGERLAKRATEISHAKFNVQAILSLIVAKLGLEFPINKTQVPTVLEIFTYKAGPIPGYGFRRFPRLVQWVKNGKYETQVRQVLERLKILSPPLDKRGR